MKIKELFNLLENANALTEAFGQGTKAFFVELAEGTDAPWPYRTVNPVFTTWDDFRAFTNYMAEKFRNEVFEAEVEFFTKFNIIGLTTAEAKFSVIGIDCTLVFSLCSVK